MVQQGRDEDEDEGSREFRPHRRGKSRGGSRCTNVKDWDEKVGLKSAATVRIATQDILVWKRKARRPVD